MDWALDFLSQGISTHSPLDTVHSFNDPGLPAGLDHAEAFSGANTEQPAVDDDGPHEDQPQAWSYHQSRDASPVQGTVYCTSSKAAAYVDNDEQNAFLAANVGKLQTSCRITESTHAAMIETVTSPLLDGFCSPKSKSKFTFPPPLGIQYFLQLYFIHVHPRFPVIHVPTFDPHTCPPILLLAMSILGSGYSQSNQGRFTLAYLERTRMSIKLMQQKDSRYLASVDNLFAFFLVSLAAMWLGHKMAYERAEGDRGELTVYCRREQLLDCRRKHPVSHPSSRQIRKSVIEAWTEWIQDEQRKRLGLSIYILDCQIAAFFQRQPYISKAETVNAALPCSDGFWNAPTVWAWKALLGPADIPPSTYFLTTLTSILLYNEIPDVLPFPPLDDFCKTLYAYVLHTHVFEWRQTICMLNPTGLLSSPLSMAPQKIGNSLEERRMWLESCLDNWATFYGDNNQADPTNRYQKNFPGILLYHLAILALRINFSDLHIVAGRSGSEGDIALAEQSLRNWLQEERASFILDGTIQMLKAAHETIAAGEAQRSGFELSICLFMSGLVFWVMSRFGSHGLVTIIQRQEMPLASNLPGPGYSSKDPWISENGEETTEHCDEMSSQAKDLLLSQVADARGCLRAIKCHRLAVAFGDILDQFLGNS
ncbi:hypothetical protein N7507_005376 [Penicillium longicatenatum]|nr:hypothetical protein N7507_005376 [Penicillium longicatenatum]